MHVVEAGLSVAMAGQSVPLASASNTMSLTLMSNVDLANGSRLFVSGVTSHVPCTSCDHSLSINGNATIFGAEVTLKSSFFSWFSSQETIEIQTSAAVCCNESLSFMVLPDQVMEA
eukprot:2472496-Rhodomonas_salina.1